MPYSCSQKAAGLRLLYNLIKFNIPEDSAPADVISTPGSENDPEAHVISMLYDLVITFQAFATKICFVRVLKYLLAAFRALGVGLLV